MINKEGITQNGSCRSAEKKYIIKSKL